MALSLRQDLIRAFFDDFGRKIERLKELHAGGFKDEAFTLSIVYVDRLAAGNYDPGPGQNGEAFRRALRELGNNRLFEMIHLGELLRRTKERLPVASVLLESLAGRQPGALLSESELSNEILRSSLLEHDKKNLVSHLWRPSMANICYEYIRNPQVHGPRSIGFTFDETTFDGKKGVRLDFHVVHAALHSIWAHIRETSIKTGEWFGRPGFLKT